MSNILTDTQKLDDLEDRAEHQEEANKWYEDLFGGKERREQIELAWKKGGEFASALQDEIYGFTHWATYHELQQKVYYLELATNCRLKVTTDLKGTAIDADFQFQDTWPWVSAQEQNTDLLVTYAKIVGLYDE